MREGDDGRKANELLIHSLIMTGDDQLALGKAAAAVRTFNTALGSVSPQNCPLRHCLDEKLGVAKARRTVDRTVQKLEARLKSVLRDPVTAQQLGMIRLLDFDDPAAAARCFQGADPEAERDANVALATKSPAELDEDQCLKLAAWYWRLAPKAGPLGKVSATARAKQYYEQFLVLHTEDDSKRVSAQAALDQAATTLLRLRTALCGGWVDLLALVDPAKDYIGNPYWKRTDDGLSTVWGSLSLMMIPYEPPPEYDLEISFTCTKLKNGVGAVCTMNGRLFTCLVGCDGNTKCGLEKVGGLEVFRNGTMREMALRENRRYVLCIQVRARGVQVHLDRATIINYPTNGSDLSPSHRWDLPNARALGVGSYHDVAVFHSIWLREVAGTGRPSAERGRPD